MICSLISYFPPVQVYCTYWLWTRRVPRCNVKLCRKKEDVNNDDKISEKDEKVGVKFEEGVDENKSSEKE